MYRTLTSVLSPAGKRARLSAFIFHRVLDRADPLLPGEPDAAMFDRMLGWIGGQFNVLPSLEACDRLLSGTLPARAAIITFDDGYRDNWELALPILQRRRMSAVFFVATGYLNGGAMFNDRVIEAIRCATGSELDAAWLGLGSLGIGRESEKRAAIDRLLRTVKYLEPVEREDAVARIERACGAGRRVDLMMTDAQVVALRRAGMEIGGHTRNHPILRSLSEKDAAREIAQDRDALGAITGSKPELFAYPNGKAGDDFDLEHCRMVKQAGYRAAFTTQAGASASDCDPMMLRRYTPWSRTRARFHLQALANLLH